MGYGELTDYQVSKRIDGNKNLTARIKEQTLTRKRKRGGQ